MVTNYFTLYLPTCSPNRPLQIFPAGSHINLGRIQALMPQEHPHLVEPHTSVDQVLGEGMPQRMGGTIFQPGLIRILAYQLIDPT